MIRPTTRDHPDPGLSSARRLTAQLLALAAGIGIILYRESLRVNAVLESGGLWAWFWDMDLDTSPLLPVMLTLPLFWFWPVSRRIKRPQSSGPGQAGHPPRWLTALLSVSVAAVSLSTSLWIASRPTGAAEVPFGSLPPAYHDEYSYLFQAHTFLSGRVFIPSHPEMPELFDQMHVLNEGRMASRYFPGTGLWMLPFAAWGHPYWGHWLAGALACVFVLWTGIALASWRVGLLAGLLTGLSPGIALFGNLLLSHHPTLMAVTAFVWAMTVFARRPTSGIALAAGTALAFAMLCRPMTAAAIGLPYGIWLLWWALSGTRPAAGAGRSPDAPSGDRRDGICDALTRAGRVRRMVLVGLPVLLGGGLLMAYDTAITGDPLVTPYQLYTEIYTPRHVYGFNNVVRGEQHLGPKVIDDYDRWAENLTLPLALRNVRNRIVASWQWTLGLVPLAMAAVVFCLTTPRSERGWWLVAAAIFSLHAAHVPYWYDGIMHFHYVFESAPLWCLIFARSAQRVTADWDRWSRPAMKYWLAIVIAAALVPQYVALLPFWQTSRLSAEMRNVAFSRLRYAEFNRAVQPLEAEARADDQPVLILVKRQHDVHIDYVTNLPPLDRLVLRGRFEPNTMQLEDVQKAFPERRIYLFDMDALAIRPVQRRPIDAAGAP